MSIGVAKPFTPEQVAALEAHQRAHVYHPFTCANRGDGKHGDIDGDTGILVPTVRGWIYRYCDYTQDWAHAFMAQPQPVERPHSCKFPGDEYGVTSSESAGRDALDEMAQDSQELARELGQEPTK